MKKILLILFTVVIFVVGSVLAYKKISYNKKEQEIIQLFNKESLESFSKNKDEILEKLKTLDKEEANEFYKKSRETNDIILEKINREHDNLSAKNFTDEKWDIANKFLKKYDLELFYIENDEVIIGECSDFYYKTFKDYVTEDYKEFLKIISDENMRIDHSINSPMSISLEEVANRIIARENFLEKYPNSKLSEYIHDLCNEYRRDYLYLYPDVVPDYKENLKEYKRFQEKYPNSPTTELIGYYLMELNTDNFEDNDNETLTRIIDEYINKYFYLGYLKEREKGNYFSYDSNKLFEEFKMIKEETSEVLKNSSQEEANKIYKNYLEDNNKILEKINENDYTMLDNAFYIGEGDIDKEKLNKQNKFLDSYGLEVTQIEDGFMLTEKKDFYYNIFKNYVSDDYKEFLKLRSEDIDYFEDSNSFDKYLEIIADKIVAWEKFLEKYPDSKLKRKAQNMSYTYRAGYIFRLTSSETRESLMNGKANDAVKEFNRFIKKYPNSPTSDIIKYYLENYKEEDIDTLISKKLNKNYEGE
ncbi:tetratricopeptide repeat protein [Fusobacterium pseudoperiodonticum]|uniref:tetratricopeptide repeat protein n=1 Tax=Fusobacterium pseudoperiodonticum TaxID=2663009 RepID=UPI0030CDA208